MIELTALAIKIIMIAMMIEMILRIIDINTDDDYLYRLHDGGYKTIFHIWPRKV
jgi:hypothetical protein